MGEEWCEEVCWGGFEEWEKVVEYEIVGDRSDGWWRGDVGVWKMGIGEVGMG